MQIEAIKKDGHFVVPYLDELDIDVDKITITIDDNIINGSKKVEKSKTYKAYEKLNKELGGDPLIELIMSGMPLNYEYKSSGMTDKEIWYEERKAKYE